MGHQFYYGAHLPAANFSPDRLSQFGDTPSGKDRTVVGRERIYIHDALLELYKGAVNFVLPGKTDARLYI